MQGIHTLIKLHRRELDSLRRELVRKEEQKQQLIELATQLHRELLQERELAAENPLMSGFMADFEKRMQKRQLGIAQEVIQLDAQLAELSAAIADRFGELKKYEITRDNRIASEKAAADSREQAMLDEVGLQRFTRQEGEKKS